jgi:anti-sigma B factor antagonist
VFCPALARVRDDVVVSSEHSPDAGANQPATLSVRVEPLDDAVVLSVSGEIDLVTAPQLSESINAAMDQEPPTLVVDLSDVDFLASAGMAVLLGCNQRARGRIRFRVVAAGITTFRPMEVAGVPDEIAIFPTREEALAADG